jgi:uncharacterized RDD family membrane protein YckC
MPGQGEDETLGLADTVAGQSPQAEAEHEGPEDSGRWETATGDHAGLQLDHFVIERPLGHGGMGTVYLAHDISLDRKVAIKMMHSASAEPQHQQRLLREARAQAGLNHPSIVHIYYIGRRDTGARGGGPLFFAMEYVRGESLDDGLERGERLDPERARRDMLEVAKGLRAARQQGIIHRDIKPSNLLRDPNGPLKIADFGLAKPLQANVDTKITQQGALLGSPLYMAPEQARADELDHRTDMYALGASFFHLMAGRPPYEGNTSLEVIAKHLSEPVPSLTEARPDVPPQLEEIIGRLMAKDPSHRFADYDELIAALESAAPRESTYAGFWIRAAAASIDALLGGGLIALLGWPGGLVHLLHVTVGHAWRGKTLAKHLLNIQVRQLDGTLMGYGRSFGRTVGALWMPFLAAILIALGQGLPELGDVIERLQPQEIAKLQNLIVAIAISNGFLSLLYAGGLALAAFHPHKRALHDLLVGTIVVYRFSDSSTPTRSTGGGE